MNRLKFALQAVYLDELEKLPSDSELCNLIVVSEGFERKMNRLFRSKGRVYPKRRIMYMILVAILAALMTSVMSIQAFREPIAGFFLDIYEYCTDLIFQSETVDQQKEKAFIIPDAPSGYTEISREEYQSLVSVEYYSAQGHTVIYTQYRQEGAGLSVDTENADTNIEEMHGFQVFLYSSKGWNSMIWNDGSLVYELNGDCGMQELCGIAEVIMNELR